MPIPWYKLNNLPSRGPHLSCNMHHPPHHSINFTPQHLPSQTRHRRKQHPGPSILSDLVLCTKRGISSGKFVEDTSRGPDICFLIVAGSNDDFWSAVIACHMACCQGVHDCRGFGGGSRRKTKVCDFPYQISLGIFRIQHYN